MKKCIIYFVSALMAFSNTAYGKSPRVIQISDLKEFLKESNIHGKTTTVRQLFEAVKPGMNEEDRAEWVRALLPHMDEKIPTMRLSWLESEKEGQATNVKLYVNEGSQSYVIEIPENPDTAYRFNGVEVTYADLEHDGGRSKIVSSMPASERATAYVRLKYQGKLLPVEWLRLAKKPTLKKYFTKLRELNLALEAANNGKNKKFVLGTPESGESFVSYLMNCLVPKAQADMVGNRCSFAGWTGSYKNKSDGGVSCHPPAYGVSHSCTQGQVPCNPAIFGRGHGSRVSYTGQGQIFCATRTIAGNFNDATMQCHNQSPVEEIIKYVEESHPNDPEGARAELERYNQQLLLKIEDCEDSPAAEMDDQVQACKDLRERLRRFEDVKVELLRELPPPMLVPEPDRREVAALVHASPGPILGKQSFWSKYRKPLLLFAGLSAAAGLVWFLFFRKKKRKPVVVGPVPKFPRPSRPMPPPTKPTKKEDRTEPETPKQHDQRPAPYNQVRPVQ